MVGLKSTAPPDASIYRRFWDSFVEKFDPAKQVWPGDEWGNPESWQRTFETLFVPYGVSEWKNCVEIGGGSGKYTVKVLEAAPQAKVIAADISPQFQQFCKDRLAQEKLTDRATFVLLDSNPATLLQSITAANLKGTLDALFSIDAMVHVDLQYLVIYFATAALTLRPQGKIMMTLANSTSDRGFEKLIGDARNAFRSQHGPSGKFEWMSPDMVADVLRRLGFSIDLMQSHSRDIHLVASKTGEPPPEVAGIFG